MPRLERCKADGRTLRCQAIYERGERVGQQCASKATFAPDYDFCGTHKNFGDKLQKLHNALKGLTLASATDSGAPAPAPTPAMAAPTPAMAAPRPAAAAASGTGKPQPMLIDLSNPPRVGGGGPTSITNVGGPTSIANKRLVAAGQTSNGGLLAIFDVGDGQSYILINGKVGADSNPQLLPKSQVDLRAFSSQPTPTLEGRGALRAPNGVVSGGIRLYSVSETAYALVYDDGRVDIVRKKSVAIL